jgi:hypothetical protein
MYRRRFIKITFFAFLTLSTAAGYWRYLDLSGREVRELRIVDQSEYMTLERAEHGYSYSSRAKDDNFTLTVRATEEVIIVFVRYVEVEECLEPMIVETHRAKALTNHTFGGYPKVGFMIDLPEGVERAGVYVEVIKPRWVTRKTHLEEAAPVGYLSTAGGMLTASWLLLEASWWVIVNRIHPVWKATAEPRVAHRRILRVISPIPLSFLLFQIDFWAFGFFFDPYRNPPHALIVVTAWILLAMVRAGAGIYVSSLVLGIPLRRALSKRGLFLAYYLVGLPLVTTQMTVFHASGIGGWYDSLTPFMPLSYLESVMEAIKGWVTAQGFSYETYLTLLYLAIMPLLIELPRLLAFILMSRHLVKGEQSDNRKS